MIGHVVARPGPEEAVTVYDRDGLKISAFLVKDLKILGQKQGYGSRAQAETAMKGLNCRQLPG